MAENSLIEWTTHTFNPWIGCTKVSPGCAHCYAATSTPARAFGVEWGAGKPRRRTGADTWKKPERWNRAAGAPTSLAYRQGRPRVFPSLMDWLDDEAPIEWLADFLALIRATPNLDWLLLTKRPDSFTYQLQAASQWTDDETCKFISEWLDGDSPGNVWLGVSIEDQKRADERIPELLHTPAAVRFISAEPLLGELDLTTALFPLTRKPVDWIITGGESHTPGHRARECKLEWLESAVDQCKAAGASVFVKQLGDAPTLDGMPIRTRAPKGGDPSEWPEQIRIREFPRT